MKKIFLTFMAFFATMQISYCQTYQLFSVTPFSQVEKIGNEWRMTAPINLQYNVLKSFGAQSNYFVGLGLGGGINFNGNDNGTINLNFPLTGYVGGQIIEGLPALAIGGGVNLQNGNPLLMINLHFSSTSLIPSIPKASERYKQVVDNTDYKQTKIGFKPN